MSAIFDEIINRRNTNSVKWDSNPDPEVLPMWVADMDFKAAQPILDALASIVRQGILGYAKIPDKYYDAVLYWFAHRHHFQLQKEWILPTTGVIPALSATIKALTNPGDKILVQKPVYNGFFPTIKNNNCEIISSDLIYADNTYKMDFEDLAIKLSDPKVTMMLLCSPHNPAGRVWTKEELEQLGELCIKNNVIVVSDEIHADLVFNGYRHIPFGSINERFLNHSVTCTSPSKTFNLAGLQVANIFVANENYRNKIAKALISNTIHDLSPFAIEALVAAYKESANWLDDLLDYLHSNYNFLQKFIQTHLPKLKVIRLEATYLVWIDCSQLSISMEELNQKILNQGHLWINVGNMYGEPGNHFIRINIACPLALLSDGLQRLKNVMDTI